MGVEEEFFLVDRRTRAPVARAPQVIAQLRPYLGEQVQSEFFRCLVEVCTRPVLLCADLRDELAVLRTTVAAAARDADCLLLASGTPVVPPPGPLPVTDSPRYRRLEFRYASVVDSGSSVTCGCHVHIGTLRRAEALALANHVRPWLPVLQALAVNSPLSSGRESGFAGWRAVEMARWPTVEPAPVLDAAGYEATARALVASGRLLDRRMIYWHARPSEHVPTLEIRIADVNADVDCTVLLAALIRGLCTALLYETEDGRPPPYVPVSRLRAAHWRAARVGTGGPGIDPVTGAEVPMRTLVERLLTRAAPGLAAAGDLALAVRLLDRHLALGTGADRQRLRYRQGRSLRGVVDQMAALATATEAPMALTGHATHGRIQVSDGLGGDARPKAYGDDGPPATPPSRGGCWER
ncbi:carboxylate-amine ligase [Streptomyces sp. WMMC940]|uniref:carboxylate-amine ligase n=1 Tax=Streptomyces sp. WMMC940 TaxID=3015153 RepID=UPI0022B66A2E|nr:glutamate--cysteine ligase [Streptomyces sp. WMMC940]MCZ7456263.1 glutamate--cysteine ligase [Streptomyces sp. WMMC940]